MFWNHKIPLLLATYDMSIMNFENPGHPSPDCALFPNAGEVEEAEQVDSSIVYIISNKWYPTQAENEIFLKF